MSGLLSVLSSVMIDSFPSVSMVRRCVRLVGAVALLLPLWFGLAGCVVEREFAEEDAAEPESPPTVPPYGSPLFVTAAYPANGDEDVARNTPLWMSFDQYLEADLLSLTRSLKVRSNGINGSVRISYDMTHKRLVARLSRPLPAGFEMILSADPDTVMGLGGAPLIDGPLIRFSTGTASEDTAVLAPEATWGEVEAVLEEGCGCHRLEHYPEEWFDIPALTYERMVGQRSLQRPERWLVDPYRPANSYLMHKILGDYPDRSGTAMPPAWADEVALQEDVAWRGLTLEETALIEDWIRVGAPAE